MNDLETDLKNSLDRAAGSPSRQDVPDGTLRRIRARQARAVGAGMGVIALFIGGVLVPASAFAPPPAEGPFSRPSVTEHATAFPRKIVAPAAGASLDVTYGGDFTPFVDDPTFDEPAYRDVIGAKHVVSYGTIQGVPWSLVGYKEAMLGVGDSAGVVDVGQCAELFIGADGEIHDTAGCYNTSAGRDRYLSLSAGQIADGAISVFYGSADPQVAHVELRFGDGSVQEVMPTPGPEELGAGLFVAFRPGDVAGENPTPVSDDDRGPYAAIYAGTVIAFDASGHELTHGPLCMARPHPGASGVCSGPH